MVTAAALIMIAVFSGFIISDDVVIKSIGLALAFGVLADAFPVKMTLVPAVLPLLDRRARWLPRGMKRRMPNLDIEGEKRSTSSSRRRRASQSSRMRRCRAESAWRRGSSSRGGCGGLYTARALQAVEISGKPADEARPGGGEVTPVL